MKELVKELLRYESELLYKLKSNNQIVVRPSSIVLVILAILYCTSGVDLFPEAWVRPFALGLVDDLIVVVLVLVYTYKDWSDLSEIRIRSLPFTRNSGESEVLMGDGHEDSYDSDSDTDDGTVLHDPNIQQARKFTVPSSDDTSDSLDSAIDALEQDERGFSTGSSETESSESPRDI